MTVSETVHATAVLAGAEGVLIRGPSGSGKSTLAWLLLQRGGRLVADDRVHLSACHGRLIATARAPISGHMELRGRGILSVPFERSAVIRLIVDILDEADLDRLPDHTQLCATILGVHLPRQPVPANSARGLPLVEAALGAISAHGKTSLRSAFV